MIGVAADNSLLEATDAPTLVKPGAAAAPSDADDATTQVDGGVLAGEEIRTRMGALRALFIALVIFVGATVAMPSKTTLGWVMIGVYAVAAVVVGGLIAMSRRYQYGSRVSTLIGVMIVLLALGSCVYFGIMGGPIVVLPTVVFYYGLGDSKPRRRWVAGTAIGGHAVLALLAAFGVVPPTGLIPAEAMQSQAYIFMTGICVGTLLVATYWLSYRTRHSTLLAMAELERARRGIRQRDALLNEAHEDLDRVVAGARAGRLTGRTIDQYVLGSVVGRGSMGEVYEATNTDGGQIVALKVMHPHLSESRGQVTRFIREAQITSALESPHVPKLFASGTADDGSPYLVLELLQGVDLAADLRQRTYLPLEEVDVLVQHACLALHAAHEADVVHRDIKPQNLFLTVNPHPVWKVLDFGVSMFASGSGTLTQGGAVGTPAYMAPEQALGKDVDRRADVFSLGAVVYRALTGRPAFRGTSNAATVYAALRYQPVRPSELVEVHSDVDLLLALALAKKPDLRLSSTQEFAAAWRDARHGRLSPELHDAASRIVAVHPWGTDYTAK